MDELDLYDDLDEFQEQQEKKSKEIKEVEEKYQQSLKTIEGLREENKNLKKNIQSLELGFQSLLDTARAEINRKNKEIERLRKEKDDICFRRKIPQNVASESEKQKLVHNPFRFNTTQDSENLLTKINSKPTASHTDKEEKPESNKRSRHHYEEELLNSTDYKRHRIARDEQNNKHQYSSHKIDKSCSKTEDNHRGYRENDKDSMYRKDHNRNHSRGRKDYDKSNSRNPHRDFRKSSESPERYKKHSDRSSSTESKRYNNKQKVYDRSRSREGKHSAIFSNTSSKSPTPNIKPNKRDTNRDNYYHERSSKKTENEKSHKTVDDLGELKSKVFEGAKNPITTENSKREICNMPTSKHNLEPSSRCDQKISQNSTIVHIKDQEKIQSVKKLTKKNETKQNLSLSSIPKTSEIGTPRKVALYNEIFGKSPSESSTTASSNILLNSIKSILDKTSQIEVISSATTSPGDYTDISSCTSTPLRNATNIISSIKTSSDSIKEVNKDKSMTKQSLGDTSEIDSCFIPTQQNLEQNIKSVAYIDLTEVVNDDIASELEYVQIPGLDLCFRDGDSTIKNKTITMADIENTDNSFKTNKIATCGKEWTQQINNKCKTKPNTFLETFHPISENEIEKELSISTEKELLNKVPNAIRKEVPTTDVLIISPFKQNTNVSEISSIKKISSHENSEKLKNITKNLANEVVVIETLKSTIIDVDLIRNDKHCLDKYVYKTTKPVETFLDHNEESEKENNNRKMTEDNENLGFDESMHTKFLTDETRSLDRSKCETAAIKIPLVVSSIASSLPEKSICHSVAFDNFDVSVRSLELESNSEEQTEPLSSTQDISKVVQSKQQNLTENLLNSAYIFNTVDHETRIIGTSQITDKNRLVKSHIDEKFVGKEVLESEKLEFAKVVDIEVLESKTENESSTQTHLSETLPNTVSTFKFLDCVTHIAKKCCAEKSDNQNVRQIEVEKEKKSDTIVSCNLSKSESVEVVQSKELNISEHCKKNYEFQAIEKEKPDAKITVNLLPEELIIHMENACENETYNKVVSTKTKLYFEDNLNDNEAVEKVQQFDSAATNELSRQEVVQRINENIFSSIEQENSTAFTEISTKTDKANEKDKNVAEITNPDISEKLFNNTENNADTKLSNEEPPVVRESNIDCTLNEAKEKACQKPVEDKIFTQNIHENCQKNTQHLSSFKDKCTTSFKPEKLLTSIKGFENETSTKDLIYEKCNEKEATTNYLSSNDIEYANNSNNESKLISSVSSKNIDLIPDSCDSTANKVESLQKSISSMLEEKTNSLEKDETKTKPAILDSHIPSAEEKRTDDNAGFNFLGSGKNCEETKTQINVLENILDKKVENFKNETSLHTNMERSTVNIEELHAKQQESNNKTVTSIAETAVETTAIPDAINSNEKQKSLTPKIANEQAALEIHKISENSVTSSRNDETIVKSSDNSNHKQESLSTDTSLEIKTTQLSLYNAESPVKLCNSITVFGTNQEDKAGLQLIDLKESEIKERESYNRTLGKNENQENVTHADSDNFNKTKDSQIILIVNEGDESSNVSESKDMEHSRNTQETLKLSTNKSGNSIETKTKTNLKNNVETLEAVTDESDVSDLMPTEFNIENKLNNFEVETGNNSTKPSKNDIISFVLKSAVEKAYVAVIKDQTPNDTALNQSVEINGDLEHLEKDESDNDKKENKSKQGSEHHPISNKPEDAIGSNHSIMSIQQTSVESDKEKDEQTLKLKESLQTQKLMLSHNIESEIKDTESKCDSTTSIKNNDILVKLTAQLSDSKNERVQEVSGTSMKLTEQLPNIVKEGPDSHVSESLNEEMSKVLQQDIGNDLIRSSEITYNDDDDLKMGNSKNKLGKFLSNPSLPIGSKVASLQDSSNHKEESLTTDASLEIKTIQLSLNNAESPVKLSSVITVFETNQEDKAKLELKESEIKARESYNRTHGNSEKQKNVQHTDSDHFNKTKDSQTIFIVNEEEASSYVIESKCLEYSPKLQNLKKSINLETLKFSPHKSENSNETKTKTNLKNDVEAKPVCTLEAFTAESDVNDLIPTEFNIENKLNNSEVETGNNLTKLSKNDILSFVLESTVEKSHVAVIKDQTPNDTALYQSVELNQDLEHLEKDESDKDKKEKKSIQGSENHSTPIPETATDIQISNTPEVAINSQHSIISIQQTSVGSIAKKDEKSNTNTKMKDQIPNDTALYKSVEINEDLEHLEKDESDNDKKEIKSKQGSENHPISNKPEDAIGSNYSIISIQQTSEKDEQTLKLKESLHPQKLMLSHNIESEIIDNESMCDSTTSIKKNDILVKLTAQLSSNKNEIVQEILDTSMKLMEKLPNNVKEGPDSHVSPNLNEETTEVLQQDIDNDTIRSSENNNDDLKIDNSNSKILAFKTSNRPQETESDIKNIIVNHESAKNKTICDLFKDQEEQSIHSSLQVEANAIERPVQIETLTLNCGPGTKKDNINESPCLEKSANISDKVKSTDYAFKENFSDTSLLKNNCIFNEKQTKSQTVHLKNTETNSHEVSKVCKIIPPLVYWNINKVGMETKETNFEQDRINRLINKTQKCKQIRTKEINIEGKIIEVVKILADESHIINKTIDMCKQTTDNLTKTQCFINEIEQQTQTKSNNLNIVTCDYNRPQNFHGIPVAKPTIPNENSEVEEIESKIPRKEIEESQYQTPKKVQSSSVDRQINDIPFPSKEELPTVSTMLPETFGTHPILPSISTTSPTPSNFSGIFSKKSSSSVITEDDFNKPKKKSPHFSSKPKEYILPAASVLCNVDNLEYATKINKKLHWELLENKNELTEIEDDVDIDTTDEEQLKIKEEPLENASSSPKQISLQTKLVNRMSQKSSPSETDTQTEDESLLNDLRQQKEKHKRIKLSKVHKTKQRKNTKLPKTVRARLQAIGMSNVDTFVDSGSLIKQNSVSINLPKRKVGRPRKAEKRGAFAEHQKKRGRKPKPKENKSQQEIARNTTLRCKLVNCKESKIVENKSLDGIDVINNLENSVKILSTSVERLEICDERCTSRESVKQNKSFEKSFKDNTNKDIYNALLIFNKEDSLTNNANKSIIGKSSTLCNNNLQENIFCDFTDKGNISTETVSLIKLPKVSKTSKETEETEESIMIKINNCEKANVHSDRPKEDPSSSRETQKIRLVHKSDRETDKVFSEKKSFKTSSSSEETQDNRFLNKSDSETDDGLTEDHDQDLKIKKSLKTKSILKPIIKKKFKSKSHKNRVTNFISLEDIGIKVRPLKGHLSSFRIPKIKKDGEDKIDKSWKLETYIELENEGISKEINEQSELKRESPKILHDNISTDTSIKDRRLNIKKHAEEIVDNSLKLNASTEFEAGSVLNHIDNGKEGSKEQKRTDCSQGKQLRDNSSKEQVTGRHMKFTDKELKKEEEQHNTNPKPSKNEEKIIPSNYMKKFDNKTKTGKRKLFSTEMYDEHDAEDQVEVAAENKHTEIINKQNLSKTDEPNSGECQKSLHLPSHIANKESSEYKSIKSRRKSIVHRRIFDSSSDEDTNSNDKKTISDKPMSNELTKNTQTFKSPPDLDTCLKEHPASSALNKKESKKSIGVRRKSVYFEKSTLKEIEKNKIDESSAANSIQPLEEQSDIENSELNENKVKQSYTKNSTVVGVEAEQNKTDIVNKDICDFKLAANQNSCMNNKNLIENSMKDNNMQQLHTKAIKSDKLRRKSMYVESKALILSSPELEKVTKKPITHANNEHWNCKDIKSLDLDQDVYKNRNTNLESPAPVKNTSDQAKPKASLKLRRKSMYVEKTSLYIEEDKKDTKVLLERETRSTIKDSIPLINSELSGTHISVQQHTTKMQRKSTTQQDKSVSKHVEVNAEDSKEAPEKAEEHLISEKKVENNIGNSKNTDKGSDSVVKLAQQISIKMPRKSTNQQKKFDTCNSLNNQVVNTDFNKCSQNVDQITKELGLNVDNNQKMEPEFDSSVAVKQNEPIKTNTKCANQRKIYDSDIPDQILSNTGEVKDSDTKELKNKSGKISTHTDKGPVSAASAVASKEKSIKMRRKSTTQRQITNSIIMKQDHKVHSDIVNKSEQQPLEILRNIDHNPQIISTSDSSPALIQAKKNHRKSISYHEDSSNVLKENPENHKAADSEVSISLTQQNQEMKKNADQLKISKEKSKVLLNQDTGNTTESLYAFREKIQETHEETTLKSNGGHDKDCDSNTSVVLKQQKPFEIRRKSTNQRRILDSSSDDEPLIKKPTVTPIKVITAPTTVAKQKQRKRRVVKVLSTSMESPADVTNTSQQFDCQPFSFTSPTLNHPIFNTEVSTQSSEFVASLPVTPNQQDDNKFKEIDSKLHEIFQSPQYAVDYKTTPTVAATNLINLPPSLNDANITIDETHDFNEENDQSGLNISQINESTATLNETTAIHNKSEVKHLSLGSAEYRFEKVSDNVINLFISRKRKRKRNN